MSRYLLVPGFGGSRLWRHHKGHVWDRLWFTETSAMLLEPGNTGHNLQVAPSYNSHGELVWIEREPGTEVFVEDFGGFLGVNSMGYINEDVVPSGLMISNSNVDRNIILNPYYNDQNLIPLPGTEAMSGWIQQLHDEEVIGHPLDWRLPPWQIDWRLTKKMIESKNEPVVIVSHSLGAAYMNYFLNAFTSAEWRNKHIKLFVLMSGPLKGSTSIQHYITIPVDRPSAPVVKSYLKTFINYIGNPSKKLFSAVGNWMLNLLNPKGVHPSTPPPSTPPPSTPPPSTPPRTDPTQTPSLIKRGHVDTVPMAKKMTTIEKLVGKSKIVENVIANLSETANTDLSRNINFENEKLQKLYEESQKVIETPGGETQISTDPGVPCLCVWAETDEKKTIVEVQEKGHVVYGPGDGTVEASSSSHCMNWKNSQGLHFVHATHMDLISNPEVTQIIMDKIEEITKGEAKEDSSPQKEDHHPFPDLLPLSASMIPNVIPTANMSNSFLSADQAVQKPKSSSDHKIVISTPYFNSTGIWIICAVGFIMFIMTSLKFMTKVSNKLYACTEETLKGIGRGIVTALGGEMKPHEPQSDARGVSGEKVTNVNGGVRSRTVEVLSAPLLQDGHLCGHQWPLVGSSSPAVVDSRQQINYGSTSSHLFNISPSFIPSSAVSNGGTYRHSFQPEFAQQIHGYYPNISRDINMGTPILGQAAGSAGGLSLQPPQYPTSYPAQQNYHQPRGGVGIYSREPVNWARVNYDGGPHTILDDDVGGDQRRYQANDIQTDSNARVDGWDRQRPGVPMDEATRRREIYVERMRLMQAEGRLNHLMYGVDTSQTQSHTNANGVPVNPALLPDDPLYSSPVGRSINNRSSSGHPHQKLRLPPLIVDGKRDQHRVSYSVSEQEGIMDNTYMTLGGDIKREGRGE
eukprot:GHVH01009712.1.p1 GENE.GHVH01009712.1~~GHVH01009712.1.p1  ORF type:complete len:913 (-),score=112.97 GHVH01009712.1:306-3044(-)